jgi:hypothetical protein
VLVVVWSSVVKPRLQQIQLSVDVHLYAFPRLNTVIRHLPEAYPSLSRINPIRIQIYVGSGPGTRLLDKVQIQRYDDKNRFSPLTAQNTA